ncbi:hypothetical protein [Gulbenkiania mobilis]|uniref:hypothetical protein n=1 Tax=Gulbenkiania mobilis TaxID=397457 RepID=UPI00128F86AB|nr:hypothetical protein [Gulbenkiania mobilis]
MIVTKPVKQHEPDLLTGNERSTLHFLHEDGSACAQVIFSVEPPPEGWTHELLEQATFDVRLSDVCWSAYLDTSWVGSSEI